MLTGMLLHEIPATGEIDSLTNWCSRLKWCRGEVDATETMTLHISYRDSFFALVFEDGEHAVVCVLPTTFWE
jgi:hypothetical protein